MNPMRQFKKWLNRAKAIEAEPTAFCLATVDDNGFPDARMVLLQDLGGEDLLFHTSRCGAKDPQLDGGTFAAVFYWPTLKRQVRLRGSVCRMMSFEVERLWRRRPMLSRAVSWWSTQSWPWPKPATLACMIARTLARFPWSEAPPHWTGWRLTPHVIEFFELGSGRASKRVRHSRAIGLPDQPFSASVETNWTRERLMP